MTHLREWQRYQIAAKLEAGCTKKEIAEYLHVHPSTITREIQRNGYSRYRCYRPRIAQERAAHRWRCRHLPRRFKEDVRKKVDEMILMDYSPEQIVGVCRKQGRTVQASAASWPTAQEAWSQREHQRTHPSVHSQGFRLHKYHAGVSGGS